MVVGGFCPFGIRAIDIVTNGEKRCQQKNGQARASALRQPSHGYAIIVV